MTGNGYYNRNGRESTRVFDGIRNADSLRENYLEERLRESEGVGNDVTPRVCNRYNVIDYLKSVARTFTFLTKSGRVA